MKKVFVSVAVRGLNEEQTMAKHAECRQKITDIIGEYEDISDNVSDFHSGNVDEGVNCAPLWWFGKGLVNELAYADLAVFYGDISQTRACKLEKEICELYDIPYIVIKV